LETNHNFLQSPGQPVSDRMRELLALAAQDHVYEQRSSGQILDEIRQRLEAIEWLLREVREREFGGLTGQLDTVRVQIDELCGKPPEWAEGLAEHIESVGERVKPVAELPSLWADVGVISENVDEGLNRMQSVTEATLQAAQQMDELTKRLDRLAGTMEAASVRFNRLDKTLADLGHRSEKLEHRLSGITGKVDQSLRELAERVEQGLEAVNGRVEGVGGRLNGLDGRLEGLSGKISGVESSFEGLDRKLDGVDDRVEAVNQRVGRLPATLDVHELHRKITALGERPYIDPTDRFDALEKRLAEAVDPLIDELRARPDRAEAEETLAKIVEASRVDLTKHLEIIREDVLRGVNGVQGDVAGKVGGVHEDLMKRLLTLEETMLALAEALLRPRREARE
jgi:chromosome segregation ATPase